jgi:hypothetical protein
MNPIIIEDEIEVYQPRKRGELLKSILKFDQWVDKWKKKLSSNKQNND